MRKRAPLRNRLRGVFAAGSALGLLAHHTFETRAGVGLVFEPQLGRRGALALWGAYFPLQLWAAAGDGEGRRRLSGFNAGIGVAGVAVHFVAWPWSLHRGLPMLDEAEGLREDQLPAYNSVLWAWLAFSALSFLTEARAGDRRFAIAGLLSFPVSLVSARHHSAGRASKRCSSRSVGALPCGSHERYAGLAGRRRGSAQPHV